MLKAHHSLLIQNQGGGEKLDVKQARHHLFSSAAVLQKSEAEAVAADHSLRSCPLSCCFNGDHVEALLLIFFVELLQPRQFPQAGRAGGEPEGEDGDFARQLMGAPAVLVIVLQGEVGDGAAGGGDAADAEDVEIPHDHHGDDGQDSKDHIFYVFHFCFLILVLLLTL